jgi:hypothetical protein
MLVKLKCLGILIKLLDNTCEIGVQALVMSFVLTWWFFVVYHSKNIEIGSVMVLVFLSDFIELAQFL